MVYIENEIFEEYIKTAEKEGFITEADYQEARIGSDTDEFIAQLYGVKPNGDDDNIYEKAHPDVTVVAPAYDAANAVAKDSQEAQDLAVYLATKVPNGVVTHRRYVAAKRDLLDSIIAVGFLMDSKDETELMKLADDCAENLTKEAIWPAAAAGARVAVPLVARWIAQLLARRGMARTTATLLGETIWGAAKFGGGLILGNHVANRVFGPGSQGLINDIDNAITELEEAKDNVYPNMANYISNLSATLSEFKRIAISAINQGPTGVEDSAGMEAVAQLSNKENVEKLTAAMEFFKATTKLKPELDRAISLLRTAPKSESNLPNIVTPITKSVEFIVGDDIEDAYKQLETLRESLDKTEHDLMAAQAVGKQKGQDISNKAKDYIQKLYDDVSGAPTTSVSPEPSVSGGGALTNLVQQNL